MSEKKVFTFLRASGIFLYFIFPSKDNVASKSPLQDSLQFYPPPNEINNFICQSPSALQRSQHRYLHPTEGKLKQQRFPNSNQETSDGTNAAHSLSSPAPAPQVLHVHRKTLIPIISCLEVFRNLLSFLAVVQSMPVSKFFLQIQRTSAACTRAQLLSSF